MRKLGCALSRLLLWVCRMSTEHPQKVCAFSLSGLNTTSCLLFRLQQVQVYLKSGRMHSSEGRLTSCMDTLSCVQCLHAADCRGEHCQVPGDSHTPPQSTAGRQIFGSAQQHHRSTLDSHSAGAARPSESAGASARDCGRAQADAGCCRR